MQLVNGYVHEAIPRAQEFLAKVSVNFLRNFFEISSDWDILERVFNVKRLYFLHFPTLSLKFLKLCA